MIQLTEKEIKEILKCVDIDIKQCAHAPVSTTANVSTYNVAIINYENTLRVLKKEGYIKLSKLELLFEKIEELPINVETKIFLKLSITSLLEEKEIR